MAMRTERALVVGGGVAGLLAAAAAARHFRNVTLIEADDLRGDVRARKGVPQARHAHVLLDGGHARMTRLLPGLAQDLTTAGAVSMRGGRDVGFLVGGGWLAPHEESVPLHGLSRPLLERLVRARVEALPNVMFRSGERVRALTVAGKAVRGVIVESGEALEGDLVVDASGRGSRIVEWLGAAGFRAPDETEVDAGTSYATVMLEHYPDVVNGWKLVSVQSTTAQTRGGVLIAQEEGRGLLTFHGLAGDAPPGDLAGLGAFARTLKTPILADVLEGAGERALALGPIARSGGNKNRLRHFERGELPAGLVVLGDAVCILNPVYGQGMTIAAMAAEALDRVLRRSIPLSEVTRRFTRAHARLCLFPWTIATSEDLRFSVTRGKRMPGLGAFHGYLDQLFALATRDAATAAKLERVILLLDPPWRFMAPRLVASAARSVISRRGPAPFQAVPRFATSS